MKGNVFTEFTEIVEQKFPTNVANRLLDEGDLPSGGIYTAVGTYQHQKMVSMIVRLLEISGLLIPALIKTFGIYLFGRFHTLYSTFFEGVPSALDFLTTISGCWFNLVLESSPGHVDP